MTFLLLFCFPKVSFAIMIRCSSSISRRIVFGRQCRQAIVVNNSSLLNNNNISQSPCQLLLVRQTYYFSSMMIRRFDSSNRSSSSSFIISTQPITTTTTKVRRLASSSVFSGAGWDDKEWHHKDFLQDSTLEQKEAWLESMLRSHSNTVDVQAFLVVLKALAKSPTEIKEQQQGQQVYNAGAARRAEYWMKRLQQHPKLNPTAECYQTTIQAWANSHKENILVVVNRSERWLNELVALSESSTSSSSSDDDDDDDPEGGRRVVAAVQPTIGCFNAFLDACTRGRPGKNKKNQYVVEKNAVKAEAILRQLHSHYHHFGKEAKVVPNTDTFNFVIRGWSRCKHDPVIAKRILALLRLMEAYQRENPLDPMLPRPNTKSYAMAMDALVSVAKMKARRCFRNNHSRSIRDGSSKNNNGLQELEEAHAILDYMHDLYNAGVEGVVPHRVPYNILITGWAALADFGHQNAPFKAEEIIRTMLTQKDKGFLEASPDLISFEKVIMAWANSRHPNAGKRASWWLKKLWNDSELDSNENLLPTKYTYNIVMKALAISEGALAAENLLLSLGDKYKEEKEQTLCPNSESFAIVIRAWLQEASKASNENERFRSLSRAVEWLTSLREVEHEENLSSSPELFIGVLRGCTKCARRRPNTLDLANETFQGLKNSRFRFDTVPYCLLLQVGLDALSGPNDKHERVEFVETIFNDCCDDGLVSNMFVQTLSRSKTYEDGWTEEERKQLTGRLFPDWPLPNSWSRNLSNPKFVPTPTDILPTSENPSYSHHSSREKKRIN